MLRRRSQRVAAPVIIRPRGQHRVMHAGGSSGLSHGLRSVRRGRSSVHRPRRRAIPDAFPNDSKFGNVGTTPASAGLPPR